MSRFKIEGEKVWQLLLQRLRDKYRLVILNEESFEERLSFRLSRLNVFVVIGLMSIVLVLITTYIIAFTPLKEYIPGYTDVTMQRRIYELQLRADSVQRVLNSNESYLNDLRKVLGGEDLTAKRELPVDTTNVKDYKNISDKRSKADSMMRADYENRSRYNLFRSEGNVQGQSTQVRNLFFYSPLKGIITSKYDAQSAHYGIDIVAGKDDAIKAIQDGTVIFAGWTVETGYVIALQHPGNIVSVYKHNSVLLKKQGSIVRAGESIAIIGESGELSTGPHLHLEIWINGNPVNPMDYIVF
ncbi:MAG: M23 family metallopeptidase [Bacteroidales bacterium]|nr:M23 family metallopeptidase [Bacteroidales bacterium]